MQKKIGDTHHYTVHYIGREAFAALAHSADMAVLAFVAAEAGVEPSHREAAGADFRE